MLSGPFGEPEDGGALHVRVVLFKGAAQRLQCLRVSARPHHLEQRGTRPRVGGRGIGLDGFFDARRIGTAQYGAECSRGFGAVRRTCRGRHQRREAGYVARLRGIAQGAPATRGGCRGCHRAPSASAPGQPPQYRALRPHGSSPAALSDRRPPGPAPVSDRPLCRQGWPNRRGPRCARLHRRPRQWRPAAAPRKRPRPCRRLRGPPVAQAWRSLDSRGEGRQEGGSRRSASVPEDAHLGGLAEFGHLRHQQLRRRRSERANRRGLDRGIVAAQGFHEHRFRPRVGCGQAAQCARAYFEGLTGGVELPVDR